MKRFRRLTLIFLLALAAIGLIASVGVVMPRTVRLLGPDGAPANAWIAYYYEGYRFNLVDTISYSRPGGITRTDGDGTVRLAGKLYLHVPLDGWLRHRVILLSAPDLHVSARVQFDGAGSGDAVDVLDDGALLQLADLAGRPEERAQGLNDLYAFVRYQLMTEEPRHVTATAETVAALAQQVITEYRSLIETHARTSRGMPTIGMDYLQYQPATEREAILARIREDLAREPLWGPYLERIWSRRIAELERQIGE